MVLGGSQDVVVVVVITPEPGEEGPRKSHVTTRQAICGFGAQSRRNWPGGICAKQDLTQGDPVE